MGRPARNANEISFKVRIQPLNPTNPRAMIIASDGI